MKQTIWSLRRPLLGAALIIGLSKGFTVLGRHDIISPELADRLVGALIGLVLVVIGNNIPKQLSPPKENGCPPAKEQALQRFSGWAFVLAGLGYALAWLVVPFPHASTVAMSLCAAAVLLVAGACLRALLRRRTAPPTGSAGG